MKKLLLVLSLGMSVSATAQVWKTLPKGVRILGYRNVTTSKVNSNFNQFGSQTSLGTSFKIDAETLNSLANNIFVPGEDVNSAAYNNFVVGAYEVDAQAQLNVHGLGFGYGITDKVMFFASVAYYNAQVKSNIKRTQSNTYGSTSDILHNGGGGISDDTLANNLENLPDVNEGVIQSAITNHYGYKPIGDWYGSGYGDLETGLMANVVDNGTWGLLVYPGVVLPTGYEDDADILQDIGFGDGQFDIFTEVATGYVLNDKINFGTALRYTYQLPTSKTLRIPESQDFMLSDRKGRFDVKYGDKVNWMLNTTYNYNNWIAFTPTYNFMYQMESKYSSEYGAANNYLGYNSDKVEHQMALTTSISSIKPFLNKEFLLPAQINVNLVKTIAGKNVPNVTRFEVELRMLF